MSLRADVHVVELADEHLPKLFELFEAASCSCYCQYWHFTGTKNDWLDRCAHRPEDNRADLATSVRERQDAGRGLVAMSRTRNHALGWMKLTRRAAVPKLRGLPVYRNLPLGDEETTYSVGCMLVHPEARGLGVAHALVHAAPTIAAAWGARAIEAYPRRAREPLYAEEVWQGPERLFVDAGFVAVHDEDVKESSAPRGRVPNPYPVYRLDLMRGAILQHGAP